MVSDRASQLTSSDSTVKAELINWELVEGRETGRETTWEYALTGHQWRSRLTKARVKAGKMRLKCMLSQMLRGKKTTLNYDELCTFLAQVAKVVNDRPVTQESFTTDKSEDDNTDGLLEKHAIKKTVGEEIDKAEDDAPEKTLRDPPWTKGRHREGGCWPQPDEACPKGHLPDGQRVLQVIQGWHGRGV